MKVWCVFLRVIDEDHEGFEAVYEKKEDAEQHMIEQAHFFSPKAEIKITQEPHPCFPTYSTNTFGEKNNLQYYIQQFKVL